MALPEEERLRMSADVLAEVEREMATEYQRLRALGQSTWDAQKGVDEAYVVRYRRALVTYEIALAALRRS